MNNLNKFTKAELINKIKNTTSKVSENEKVSVTNSFWKRFILYFTEVMNLIKLIQDLLFKITLISLIFKWIRKYPLLRKLFYRIYIFIFGLFGFSFVEYLGALPLLSDFWSNIVLILKMILEKIKNFYQLLYDWTWGSEEDDDIPEPRDPTYFENNSVSEEIKQDSNIIKYSIYGLIIITAGCLIWVYWDDIFKPGDDDGGFVNQIRKFFYLWGDDNEDGSPDFQETNPVIPPYGKELTNLDTNILSEENKTEILNNPDVKTGSDVFMSMHEAVQETKGKMRLEKLEDLKAPIDSIPSSPNDPFDRITSTFKKANEIELIDKTKFEETRLGSSSPESIFEYKNDSSSVASDETIKTSTLKSLEVPTDNQQLISLTQNWKEFIDEGIKSQMNEIQDLLKSPEVTPENLVQLKKLIHEISESNETWFNANNLAPKSNNLEIIKKQFIWTNTETWINEQFKKIDRVENIIRKERMDPIINKFLD